MRIVLGSLRLVRSGSGGQGVGDGERSISRSLRTNGLEFPSSANASQIQTADLFASGTAHYLKGLADREVRDELWRDISTSRLVGTIEGMIWPSTAVTREELGMEDHDGSGVHESSEVVARGMERRYGPNWPIARRAARNRR